MPELFSYKIFSYISVFLIGLIIGRSLILYLRKHVAAGERRCSFFRTRFLSAFPTIEFVNSLTYILILKIYGLSLSFIAYAFLSSILLVVAFIDLRLMIIPNKVVILILIVGLVFAFFDSDISWLDRLIGFFVAGLFFLLIAIVSKGGLGGGDIKLIAVCGFFIGWKLILLSVVVASITGGIFGLFLLITGRGKLKTAIPFAPFLITGIIASILFGEVSVQWYIGLF